MLTVDRREETVIKTRLGPEELSQVMKTSHRHPYVIRPDERRAFPYAPKIYNVYTSDNEFAGREIATSGKKALQKATRRLER